MPLTESEREIVEAETDLDAALQRYDNAPTPRQKLGWFSVVCLILNRTIGSGIFVTPSKVLAGTGSISGSLFFWAAGAVISTCGLLVWLECSLSIPQRPVRGETEPRGVPRSGGEKNYLEFMFPGPKFRTTSIYGIMYILLGNLSGNAIAFGIYVLEAADQYHPWELADGVAPQPNKGHVIGLAIAALSSITLLHICSRRGGILVNNAFAVVKVLVLLVMIGLGIAKACGRLSSPELPKQLQDFDTNQSFKTERHDVPSYTNSLLYIVYTYSGFEQPFSVLSEVKSPRKIFPIWTLVAMGVAAFLFILVNVAYLFAVPKEYAIGHPNIDMATLFFQHLFGTQAGARRAMASLIAFSIFGNLVVITFTAARVKQEIAKEGILPYSLTFATSHATFFARLFRDPARVESADLSESLEQTPIAALLLHWATSVTMILVTIPAKPTTAYSILVSLYSYTIVVLVGMWVSFGLLLTKLRKDKFHWQTRRRYRPMISPVHAIIYFSVCCFVLIAAFIPPSEGSPYSYKNAGVKWYLVPCIGLSAPLWGLVWYAGLSTYLSFSPYDLLVERFAFWMKDPDNEEEYIQRAEIISHIRQPRAGRWATVTGENFGEDAENGGNGNIDGMAARYRSNARMHDPSGVEHVGSLIPRTGMLER